MADSTPMEIKLYGPDDEVIATHTATRVPWGLMKQAVRLVKELKIEDMSEADVDALAGLVVEVFGNKFSIEDLNKGADLGEMMTVLRTITAKVRGLVRSPFPGS